MVIARSIAIVGINYAPEPTGIGPYTTFMAESLVGAGFDVRVITGVPHYPRWRVDDGYRRGLRWSEVRNGVRLTRLRHAVPASAGLRGRALMESSFAAAAAAALLRDRSAAVIAVTPSLASLVAATPARRRRPLGVVVQDLTGFGAGESGTTHRSVAGRIADAEFGLLRRASLVGVIASGFSDTLVAHGVERERIVDLPNFSRVAPADVDQLEARTLLGWPSDRYTVVHTGNIGRKQGLEVVLDAAATCPDVDFVLMGDGNQRAALERRAAGLANVRFLPPIDDERYPLALAAADVLLLSERVGVGAMALPSKLTAYVTARRPIIAAVAPEGLTAREVTRAGVAHVVAPTHADEIVKGISEVRRDADLRQALVGAQAAAMRTLDPMDAQHRYVAFAERLLENAV